MRTRFIRIAFALAVCALLSTAALAGVKSKEVTFSADVTVGDTVVKKGSYRVTYDEETQELKILKGRKAVAQTKADLAEPKPGSKYKYDYNTLQDARGTVLLSSVDFGGRYAVINNEKIAAARSEQNVQ